MLKNIIDKYWWVILGVCLYLLYNSERNDESFTNIVSINSSKLKNKYTYTVKIVNGSNIKFTSVYVVDNKFNIDNHIWTFDTNLDGFVTGKDKERLIMKYVGEQPTTLLDDNSILSLKFIIPKDNVDLDNDIEHYFVEESKIESNEDEGNDNEEEKSTQEESVRIIEEENYEEDNEEDNEEENYEEEKSTQEESVRIIEEENYDDGSEMETKAPIIEIDENDINDLYTKMSLFEKKIIDIEQKLGTLAYDHQNVKDNINDNKKGVLTMFGDFLKATQDALNEELPKLSKELTRLKNDIDNDKNIEGFRNVNNNKLFALDRMLDRLNINVNRLKSTVRGNEKFTNFVKNNYNSLSLNNNNFLKEIIPRNIESFVTETKKPSETTKLIRVGDTLFGHTGHSPFYKKVDDKSKDNIDDKKNINDDTHILAFNELNEHSTLIN
jgi:hypothetical protein